MKWVATGAMRPLAPDLAQMYENKKNADSNDKENALQLYAVACQGGICSHAIIWGGCLLTEVGSQKIITKR